ncbi:hypothetical protein [Actinomadura rugatobispora]|uniref:Uncharacterized protein n=1 Tax=Actinomadura rugatobispora TaxID=1994 RepID=A0ABW1ABY6_9ACTN|nr:hypothetical protein GCM10010200_053560 [Actinomadura rugatobispora]
MSIDTTTTGGEQGRSDAPRPAWQVAALALVAALEGRGLVAEAWGHGVVRARNPAGDPDTDDPRGQALSPRLQQEVVCRPLGGSLWWLWAWSGAERNSPAELEPLCPVSEVETAAERIARVLAVPFVEGTDGAADDRP